MSQITLTVSQIRGLTLASAKNDVRYYLNGTLFDFEHGRAVSTDGHCLLAVNVAAHGENSVIVPRDALESIAKGGKITDDINVSYDGENVTLARQTGIAITVKPIDGRFPDYQRVIPDTFSGEPAQFNPELLARISKAYCLAVNNTKAKPAIAYNGHSSALLYTLATAETAIAVIMPWKNDDDPKAALAHFNHNREPAGKAA